MHILSGLFLFSISQNLQKLNTINKKPFPFSTSVHKDVTERLQKINPALCREVGFVLKQNKDERHLRGGEATRQKYKKQES